MKDALQLKSKSGIHRLISALEERGFIGRRHHRARALEVLRLPEDTAGRAGETGGEAAGGEFLAQRHPRRFLRPHPRRARRQRRRGDRSCRCTAASPPACRSRRCATPAARSRCRCALLGTGEHYALEVAGDSMVEAGILDGDTVIIRRGDSAENGQIVVALVDDNEVTLKRLRRRGNSIALEPCNVRHETRIFPADKVKVQGRLVALLRRY